MVYFLPNTENKIHSNLILRVQEVDGILGLGLKPLYFKPCPASKIMSKNFKYSPSILFLAHQFSSIITAKTIAANYFPNVTCMSF